LYIFEHLHIYIYIKIIGQFFKVDGNFLGEF
jgi:hypothetical protein